MCEFRGYDVNGSSTFSCATDVDERLSLVVYMLNSKRERKREADREFRRRKRDKIERLTLSHTALLHESQELKRQIRELTALLPADARRIVGQPLSPEAQTQTQTQSHQQLVTNLIDAFNAGAIEQLQRVIEDVNVLVLPPTLSNTKALICSWLFVWSRRFIQIVCY